MAGSPTHHSPETSKVTSKSDNDVWAYVFQTKFCGIGGAERGILHGIKVVASVVHGKIFIARLKRGDYLKASAVRESGTHEPYGADQGVHDCGSTLVRWE